MTDGLRATASAATETVLRPTAEGVSGTRSTPVSQAVVEKR
jgi:hypothetical protein